MYTTRIKTKIDVEATLDNIPVDTVIKQICEDCHKGLESASLMHQHAEENPTLNTAKNWREECDALEGVLCKILTYLGD